MNKLSAALVGFGQIGERLSKDPVHSSEYTFSTHAQVLSRHPAFDWVVVVDSDEIARKRARYDWGINQVVANVNQVVDGENIDVVVLATKPQYRPNLICSFPNIKAVLIEKPVARNLETAETLVRNLIDSGVGVLVNYPRRYDKDLIHLHRGGLIDRIGSLRAVFGLYGRGLQNNGSHLVDLIRMQVGEIRAVRALVNNFGIKPDDVRADPDVPFSCLMDNGISVLVNTLSFEEYREVGLDLWGSLGRLQIMNEGLTFIETEVGKNRQLSNAWELRHEGQSSKKTTLGGALYQVYGRLSDLGFREIPLPNVDEVLATTRVIEAIKQSAENSGTQINLH